MKRKIFAVLLASVLTVSALPMGNVTAQAAEIDAYTVQADAINQDEKSEISVGDDVYVSGCLVDADGQALNSEQWAFVQDEFYTENDIDTSFYSDYSTFEQAEKDMVAFDGKVPEEAFGKTIYKYCGAYLHSDNKNAVWAYAPSKYAVTKWDSSKTYTVALNPDEKSVSVFTILNSEKAGKKITFPSSMKINKKSYKVTSIGDYALENSNGTGLTSISLPSTITSIGTEAFKGAKNLKTITIKGNVKTIGKNAFSGINKNAVFNIKATSANYKKIVSKIKKAGAPKTVKFKRVK